MMLLPLLLLAQAPQPITELFQYRAPVNGTPAAGEWARLPLPEAVLSQVERNLADVRLIDDDNEVIPFVVQRESQSVPSRSVPLRQISTERRELPGLEGTPHGFEEKALFQLPAFDARARSISLVTTPSTFVRRATVEVLDASGAVRSSSVSTVFRLELGQERLTLPLPLTAEAKQLRLTLVGQDDGFLSPLVNLEYDGRPASAPSLEWPLTASPSREGNTSVWRVEKPRGVEPMRLRIESRTPWFDRRVEVRSARSVVAIGRLFRLAGKPTLEVLEIPFSSSAGEQLEVRVENGDSPPLEAPRLTLIIEQPELVFAVPNGGRASLVFGGGRTRAPRFDTAALQPSAIGDDVEPVELGAIKTNPDFVAADPLKSFRRAGAEVNTTGFAHEALLRVEGAGPLEVRFEAAHAMTMRSDFRELRLVDDAGRQWPYVLRTREALEHLNPTQRTGGGKTILSTRLAVTPLALTIVLPKDTAYFSRAVVVRFTTDERLPTVAWRGWFTFDPTGENENELSAPLEGMASGAGTWEVEIDDGNDAPLKGLQLDATLRTPQLLTVLEPGTYRAMWGSPTQLAPQYDLSRVSSLLETMKVEQVTVGEPRDNASYVTPGLLERAGGMSRVLFWSVLVLAVGVLSFLALRVKPEHPS